MERPMVRIRDLRKSFSGVEVLRGFDLDVAPGEVLGVIGSSGSGKSTLLRAIMTLDPPDFGRVEIDGEPLYSMPGRSGEVPADARHLRRLRGKIGMVFQHFNLFPHMRVLRNVAEAPMRVAGLSREAAEARALEYLRRVGLEDRADAWPAQLSGGQKQRVAIARALAMEPRVLLFDEITSALDPELVGGILRLLAELGREHTATMIVVTHEMRFARESSDRVVFVDGGRVHEEGPPDKIFTAPEKPRTREFLDAVLG